MDVFQYQLDTREEKTMACVKMFEKLIFMYFKLINLIGIQLAF